MDKLISFIEQVSSNKWLAIPFILMVTFLANYRTLSLYFGGDDFSMFYYSANKICPVQWPFTSYCPVWQRLYDIFGYHPEPYYLLGIITRGILGFLFYLLGRKLLNTSAALLLSLLVVSVGGEDSLLIFYWLSENIGISLLVLISLCLLSLGKRKLSLIILSIALFYFSLSAWPIYSTGHIFIILAVILLFLRNKLKAPLTFLLITVFLLITIRVYIVGPLQQGDASLALRRAIGGNQITLGYIGSKVGNYLKTSGSFFVTDYLDKRLKEQFRFKQTETAKLTVGLSANLLMLFFIFRNIKNQQLFLTSMLAFWWLITQYLPRGMVTSFGLSSFDRHIFYPYTGFALIMGVLVYFKPRFFIPIVILVIFFNLFQTNIFLNEAEVISQKRASFYQQFRDYFKEAKIEKGAVFYFDAPRGEIASQLGSFFRAGIPSEGSIATELSINYESITLVTESDGLAKRLHSKDFDPQKFYSFYYDGQILTNTSFKTRSLITNAPPERVVAVNKSQTTSLSYSEQAGIWSGNNEGVAFKVEGWQPILPTQMRLQLKASVPEIPLPYTQGCDQCLYDSPQMVDAFDFLVRSRAIKNQARLEVSSTSDNTSETSLVDHNYGSYWRPSRTQWFQGEKPAITLMLGKPTIIEGVVITATAKSRQPVNIEIEADGRKLDQQAVKNYPQATKWLVTPTQTKTLTITILATTGDSPLIEEIDLIPPGLAGVDVSLVDQIDQAPAAMIRTIPDRTALMDYLSSGATACLEWESPGYGKGRIDFLLPLNGQVSVQQLTVPTIGVGEPTFRLGCLNYPISVEVLSASVRFLGD